MYYGQGSQYKKSYEFVPFGRSETYSANGAATYAGHIDLNINCISNLHIGGGFCDFAGEGKELVNETIKLHGKPIIPGSSFKGAVRAVAAAASKSCNPNSKCNSEERCIVCDIFGSMGRASKVIFPDFLSENAKTKIVELNSQFSPKKKNQHEYKFYKTGENIYEISKKVNVEVVVYDAVFSGRIYFKKLTEEQLSLLMFSVGLNDKKLINLKIGGFKNEGLGEVYTEATDFMAEGLNKSPAELAEQYVNMRSANKPAIDKINDILCNR